MGYDALEVILQEIGEPHEMLVPGGVAGVDYLRYGFGHLRLVLHLVGIGELLFTRSTVNSSLLLPMRFSYRSILIALAVAIKSRSK